ncbi:unnamed protein product [Clavelina lepadiformis]|uniref:Uncharacterized protein n=1 Tax=Clavelina lepadiformis TaxID=159417 RepID=A0ABP0GBZ4_CLALP
MSDDATYSLHIYPGILFEGCGVQTVTATKRTTASEVIAEVASRLAPEDNVKTPYALVELHKHRGEETVLDQSDNPVQRMLLWPRQFQRSYRFMLRQTDKDGVVLYQDATGWQEKVNEDSTQRHMAKKGFLPPTAPSEEDYPDLCALSNLNQDKILEVLKMRFMKDKIYTYTADMLISINPYNFLPIYNPKYMTIYQNRKKEDLAPHIYAIADTAFTKMVKTKQNQSIVITGKSGSGKTQATHFLVHHTLALCQKSYMTGVEHMLIGCGPVLEAMGNAQTEHNNNSSRFGKFLKIYFYESGLLSGADIQTYLLEKSRLVHQEHNERNFHIFYYLLCGATTEQLKQLHLDPDIEYYYVSKGIMMGKQEASAELERLRQAMEVVGFFAGAQENFFQLISAILQLGNITFKIHKKGRDEGLEIEDESYLLSVSKLLGLEPENVKKCLLTRKAKAGAGERFVLDLKLNEARATRDAMAKGLYQMLFEWMVNSVNMALAQRTRDNKLRSQSRWIGLLDIFGFEDFETNSFEQFCINYASEHLQHYCIKHTFQVEQEEYRQEGLTWKEVDFADNSGCLELYEKKPMGLFYLIDENFPGANNQTLLSQILRVHGSNRYFESPVVKEDAFIIRHYAGKVKYRIKDFREKNHDQVREDIITLLRGTQSSFVRDVIAKSPAAIFRWSVLRAVVRAASAFKSAGRREHPRRMRKKWRCQLTEERETQVCYVHKKMMARLTRHRAASPTPDYSPRNENMNLYGKRKPAPVRGKKKVNSISQQYQASMSALLSALEKSHPYFVRCIQPNNKKIPHRLDERLVLHQLRCSGTLQTIQLQQSRYTERMTPGKFLETYKLLFPRETTRLSLQDVKNYLMSIGLSLQKDFQIGTTQLFLRDSANRALREELHRAVLKSVILIQSQIRGYVARKYCMRQRQSIVKIQSFWRMIETQREIEEWHLAASIIQDAWHAHQNRKFQKFLIKIQAHCRGFLVRRNISEKRNQLQLGRDEEERRDQAASLIQIAWRSHVRQVRAALIIQKFHRGFVARELYRKMRKESEQKLEVDEMVNDVVDGVDIDDLPFMDDNGTVEQRHNDPAPDLQPSHGGLQKLTPITDLVKQDLDIGVNEPEKTIAGSTDAKLCKISNHSDMVPPAALDVTSSSSGDEMDIPDTSSKSGLPIQPPSSNENLPTSHKPIAIPLKPPCNTPEKQSESPGPVKPSSVIDVPLRLRLKQVLSREDEKPFALDNYPFKEDKPTSKIGNVFLNAAFPDKPAPPPTKPPVVEPVTFKRQSRRRKHHGNEKDVMDGIRSGSYNLTRKVIKPPPELYSQLGGSDEGKEKPMVEEVFMNGTRPLIKVSSNENGHVIGTDDVKIELCNDVDEEKSNGIGSIAEAPSTHRSTYKETTFPADNMEVMERQHSAKEEDLAQLQKEWLAFQQVEHERQLVELRKAKEGPRRENKRDRKIREEITSLRLEQMQSLKDKLDYFGIGIESMPDLRSLSRNTSIHNDMTPPISPSSHEGADATGSFLENKDNDNGPLTVNFSRSISMESVSPTCENKPRRQRSNSAIEMYIDMNPPSSDPITRKSSSLNAEAFAKKCMEESKVKKSHSTEEMEVDDKVETATPQNQMEPGKRGSGFMEAVRKTFWGSHRGQSRQHTPFTEKKSNDGFLTTSQSSPAFINEKSFSEEPPVGEVKVRSLEAEQISPKLLVSGPDELLLLDSFLKSKTSSFEGAHLVDQVFRSSLNEFCANLTALYSYTLLSGNTNGLRYKDIVTNFRQVLEKTANHYSLDQYAAMMAVNGFRGYMDEFMKDVLPKQVVKETKAKTKKKKHKDETVGRLGHRFTPVKWGITQVCEFCDSTMSLMEAGFMCQTCKFACHKKCLKQLNTKCPGATSSDRKTKPKKLFGEALVSLEGNDSLVPVFIDKCISYMEMNGIYQQGIYRKSAAASQNKQLEDALNKDIECQKVNFDDYSIHSVASTFKKFLRSLPQPIVPHDKYFEFLQSSKLSNEREKISALYVVLEGIPPHNHATLERIVFHLSRVALQEATNLMSPSNLAIVFTPCFISPPPHVSPIEGAEQLGVMTKGVELVIAEQTKKVKSTLRSLSEIQSAESSTNERLRQIRKSIGKGKKKRIRPSFREGPRSPTHRRSLLEGRSSLDAVEEDGDLTLEEERYEKKIATLKSRKESLTNRLPALSPQLSDDRDMHKDLSSLAFPVTNEHLRHLNKNRVSALPARRRPARYAASVYSPSPAPAPKEEGRPLRKVSTAKSKTRRLGGKLAADEEDSFRRTSMMRNPIHRPHRKRAVNVTMESPLAKKDTKTLGKTTSV